VLERERAAGLERGSALPRDHAWSNGGTSAALARGQPRRDRLAVVALPVIENDPAL
jgi:hypothetical protein